MTIIEFGKEVHYVRGLFNKKGGLFLEIGKNEQGNLEIHLTEYGLSDTRVLHIDEHLSEEVAEEYQIEDRIHTIIDNFKIAELVRANVEFSEIELQIDPKLSISEKEALIEKNLNSHWKVKISKHPEAKQLMSLMKRMA
jgi:hypothetical protein